MYEAKNSSKKYYWRDIYFLTIVGSTQSIVLIPLAAIFYTGGTEHNLSSPGFSFVSNFLSDLGMMTSYSGHPNIISSILFNFSLFFLGAVLFFYFIEITKFFKNQREAKWFSYAGSVTGVFMAIAFIGGSITPSDILRPFHLMFGALAFTIALPVAIFYTLAILETKNFPNRYAAGYALLGIVIVTYLILLLNGGATGEIAIYFTLGQKVVVFSMILCFLFEAYGAMSLKEKLLHLELRESETTSQPSIPES